MPEWADIIVRSYLFFAVLFIMTKILGKKQISEITFFEYVSGITIGSIAGEVIMGLEKNIAYGVLGILVFGSITFFVDVISLKSKKFRDFVEGKPSVFIKDGKIQEDELKKEKYSVDEFTSLLRGKNIFSTADVEFAILEPSGDLSVMLKKEKSPLTPKDLQLKVANERAPRSVIMDGQVINDALAETGKNRKWLNMELEKLNVTIENVFLGQVNSYGELTVDIYDDKINVPSPQSRPLLMAMIKKCQADLELFSLETDCDKAKNMYKNNAKRLNDAIEKLNPYLNG